jgi:transmembrane sensor
MTITTLKNQIDHQRLQQAANWFALLADGDVSKQEQKDFELWLKSADNQQAWGFVDGVSQQFTNVRQSEYRNVALNALGSPEQIRYTRRSTLKLLSLLPISAFCAWGSYKYTPLGAKLGSSLQASFAGYINDYASDTGQIKHISLADNSHISLNTASAINVSFNDTLRLIDLVRGEILIDTAKDARPFEVQTTATRLRALGTRFSVRQFSDNAVQLSVFEGRVAIYRPNNESEIYPDTTQDWQGEQQAEHVVEAGQQIMISMSSATNIQTLPPTSTAQITWQQGLLLAEEITLAEFIEQVARYRTGYLGVSPEIAHLKIMGSFPIDDTDKTLAMLSKSLPIKINSITPWWVSLEPL